MPVKVSRENLVNTLNAQNFDFEFRSLLTLLNNRDQIKITFRSKDWEEFVGNLSKKLIHGETFQKYLETDPHLSNVWEMVSKRKKV